jgi:hypothetical protein
MGLAERETRLRIGTRRRSFSGGKQYMPGADEIARQVRSGKTEENTASCESVKDTSNSSVIREGIDKVFQDMYWWDDPMLSQPLVELHVHDA